MIKTVILLSFLHSISGYILCTNCKYFMHYKKRLICKKFLVQHNKYVLLNETPKDYLYEDFSIDSSIAREKDTLCGKNATYFIHRNSYY